MQRWIAVFVLLLAGAAGSQDRPGWQLVWSDEFDNPGLPDAKKWTYEKGFLRNKELQYYTKARLENARVEDGNLIIEGRKEEYRRLLGKNAHYTSASLTTADSFKTAYGRIEMRAQLPYGRGVWPAFWMLGGKPYRWPKCGEIDIMEAVGHKPGTVFATVHWFGHEKGRHTSSGGRLEGQSPSDGFHIYAVEWFADRMDFYYDEINYFTFPVAKAGTDKRNPFHKPHYLLINLAIGGTWGGEEGVDDRIFPQQYKIDYVRVYKKDER